MAQAGNKVLILDADFRRPTQHKNFGITDNGVGLSGVLVGDQSLDNAIHHTDVDGLDVLVCGAIPPNPAEMLNSRIFADTLQQLTEKYDKVILDAPPLIPVTDALILGSNVDGTCLVLRSNKTSKEHALQAKRLLEKSHAKIIGTIINDINYHCLI